MDFKCIKCKDTGWYQYDENHSQVCDMCCTHDQGWWLLTEHHSGYDIKTKDNFCCKAGCGTLRRDLK